MQMLQVPNLILSALCDYKYRSGDKIAEVRVGFDRHHFLHRFGRQEFMCFADPQFPAALSRDHRRSPAHTADLPYEGSRL